MMIISEPEPTDVMPTTIPPTIPIPIVRSGRGVISWICAVRSWPARRSRM